MDILPRDDTMSAQEFYTLLVLTDKKLHGYGIRNQVVHDSEGSVVMATGTTYSLLKRLLREGSIAVYEDVRSFESKITYRYNLTDMGKKRLEGEVRRLEYVSRMARYKLSPQRAFSP